MTYRENMFTSGFARKPSLGAVCAVRLTFRTERGALRVTLRFRIDDITKGVQRHMVREFNWPWPWPPYPGMMLQPPQIKMAFEVTHVIYELGTEGGAIVIDFVSDRLGDGDGAFGELEAAGWRDVPAPDPPSEPN